MPFDLFVSYAHHDATVVAKVTRRLHDYGIDCFLDDWQLRGGDALTVSLQTALAQSEAALIFVSQAFVQSVWCEAELKWIGTAASRRASFRVIPICLDSTPLSGVLADRVWFDLRDQADSEIITVANKIWKALGKGMPGIFGRTGILAENVVARLRNVIDGLQIRDTHPKLVEIVNLLERRRCGVRNAGPCQCGGTTLCGFINLGSVDWYSNFFHLCMDCFKHDHAEVYEGAGQESGAERMCPWCKPLWFW